MGDADIGALSGRVELEDNFTATLVALDSKLKQFGDTFETMGGHAKTVGRELSTNITLPLTAMAGAALKASIDFESAFSDVRKTVNATESELAGLKDGIIDMSKSIPVAATELSKIASIGGQFGVSTEGILTFTDTVARLAVSIDGLNVEDAAAQIAQIGKLSGVAESQFGNLASVLVRLGNEGTSTEAMILGLTQRLTSAGVQAGFSADEIFGIGASLANVGVEAEAGGTAISKVFLKMKDAALDGGSALDEFARVSDMSAEQFARSFKEKPAEAFQAFVAGVARMTESGQSLTPMFDTLELTDTRLKNAVASLGLAAKDMAGTMASAKEEFQGTNALMAESEAKFGTTANQMQLLWNQAVEVARKFGDALVPALRGAMDVAESLLPYVESAVDVFASLPTPVQGSVLALGGLAAAAGPVIFVAGSLIESWGAVSKALAGLEIAETVGGWLTTMGGAATVATGAVVALAAVGLGAAFLEWVDGWDEVSAMFSGIVNVGGAAADAISQFVQTVAFLDDESDQTKESVSGVVDYLQQVTQIGFERWSNEWIGGLKELEDGFERVAAALAYVRGELPKVEPPEEWKRLTTETETARVAMGGLAVAFGEVNTVGMVAGVTMADLEGKQRAQAQASEEAAKAAKKEADELAKLTGQDVLDRAEQMVERIDRLGGTSKVAAGKVGEVSKLLNDAIEIMIDRGDTPPQKMREFALALDTAQKNTDALRGAMVALAPAIEGIGDASAHAFDLLPNEQMTARIVLAMSKLRPAIEGIDVSGSLDEADKKLAAVTLSMGERLESFGFAMSSAAQRAIEGGGSIAGAMLGAFGQEAQSRIAAHAKKLEAAGETMSGSLVMAGSAAAGLSAGMANFAAVNEGASKSSTILSGALTGVAQGFATGNVAAGLLAGGIAILGGLFGDAEKKVNDTRDAAVAAAGGIDELNVMAQAAGTTLDAFLDADNPKKYEAAMNDLKAAFAAHQKELEEWGSELEDVLSTGSLLTQDLIEQTTELFSRDRIGTTDTLFAYLGGQIDAISDGFNTAAEKWAEPLLDLAENAKDATEELDDLKKSGKASGDELKAAMEKAERATQDLADAVGDNEDDFRRYGSIAIGTFEQLREAGLSVAEAFAEMRDGLEVLADAAETLGYDAGDAFDELLNMARVADEFQPALDQIDGLDDLMVGLHGSGLLTSSMFYDLAGQVADTFGDMVSKGANAEDAMRLIQPQVQRIWELQQDLGYEVDEATQRMIDQGVEAGVVGDKFRDANDRMTRAVEALINRLGDLIAVMTGNLPSAAQTGAGQASAAIGGIGDAAWAAAGEANAAIASIDWGALEGAGTEALGAIEEGGATAAWGSSPTGIKEIGVVAALVINDLLELRDVAVPALGAIETEAGSAAGGMANEFVTAGMTAEQALLSIQARAAAVMSAVGVDAKDAAKQIKAIQQGMREASGVALFGGATASIQDAAASQLRNEHWKDWIRDQSDLTQALVDQLLTPAKGTFIGATSHQNETVMVSDIYDLLARTQVDRYLKGQAADELSTLNAVIQAQQTLATVTMDNIETWTDQASDAIKVIGDIGQELYTSQSALFGLLDSEQQDVIDNTRLLSSEQAALIKGTAKQIADIKAMGVTDTTELSAALGSSLKDMYVGGATGVVGGFQQAASALAKLNAPGVAVTNTVRQAAEALSIALPSAMSMAQNSGSSFLEMLTLLGGGAQTLATVQEDLGLSVSGVTERLLKLNDTAASAGPLLDFATGLDEMLTGLANTGGLSNATFGEMAGAIHSVAAELMNMAGSDGLMLVQPALQHLWELSDQWGFSLDANTASMLQQAEAAGVIGEAYMSADERIASAMEHMVEKLDELISRLLGTTGAAAVLSDDLPRAAVTAETALANLGDTGVAVLGDIEDAAARAAWGSSPTGIKEISVASEVAGDSLVTLGAVADAVLGGIEAQAKATGASVSGVWNALSAGSVAGGGSAMGGGPGLSGAGGGNASVDGSFVDTVWNTIVEAYKTGSLSDGMGGIRAILDPFSGAIIDPYDSGFGGGPHLSPRDWARGFMGMDIPQSVFDALMLQYGGPQHSGWDPSLMPGGAAVNDAYVKAYLTDVYKRSGLSDGMGGQIAILDPFSGARIDPYTTPYGGGQPGFTAQGWATSMGVSLPQSWFDEMMAIYGGPSHGGWEPDMMPAGWMPADWLDQVPTLDTGAIVSGPTLALLAANNRPEAVVPLDRLDAGVDLDDWADAVTRALVRARVAFQVGPDKFGELTADTLPGALARRGTRSAHTRVS